MADTDDIIRQINEEDANACGAEIQRLWQKRKGYMTAFKLSVKALTLLIDSSRGGNGVFDRSPGKHQAIERERERLEQRYEKLQLVQSRAKAINKVEGDNVRYDDAINAVFTSFQTTIESLSQLMMDMLPANEAQPGNNNAAAPHGNVRPMTALKPSFELSFDNSPTELACWMDQFRAYFEASRLIQLDVQQQQAFLRQGIHPDVWTAIQQRITIATPVFRNPNDLDEESCESYVEDAFQIRYPLIMRRYKFFTYRRKGNQTFTNFFAKLKELATAAKLENMDQNDYLIFRVLVGIDDPSSVDKLLAIPATDFNLEEVHRVATSCEAAKNYSGLADHDSISRNVSNQAQNFKTPAKQTKGNGKKNATEISYKDFQHLNGASKITALREHGLCVRCGQEMHPDGEKCPHQSTQCHNCGSTGHISVVCSKSNTRYNPHSRNQAHQTSVTNHTFATFGPKPTPSANPSL